MDHGRPEKRITVIVSVYNVAPYIRKCLASIARQTSDRFELLILDDSSTDGSGVLCREGIRNIPFARYFRLSHRGISDVRNFGLSRVKTPYVLFVDGDDYLEPDAVAALDQAAESDSPDLAVCGYFSEIDGGGQYPVALPEASYRDRGEMERHFPEVWDAGLLYSTWNKLFRTDLIRRHGMSFERRTFGEDLTFCEEYLRHCRSMRIVGKCLYHYVSHGRDSLSAVYRPDLFQIRVREHRELTAYFQDVDCDRAQAEEFLSRRHIERVAGCVENACSGESPNSLIEKWREVRRILRHPDTISCAKSAKLRSRKMKVIVWTIKTRWTTGAFLLGCVMSLCKRRFPRLFVRLKMHR